MGDPTNLDSIYLRDRQFTDQWQAQQLAGVSGGSGTLSDPKTTLTVEAPKQPEGGGKPKQAGEDETLAPSFTPIEGEWTNEPPINQALKSLGKKGKDLAEAIHPGVVAAGRAIGLDETQADAMATGLTEFIAGLPGPDTEDEQSGIETGLAAIPFAGMLGKATKGFARFAKANPEKAAKLQEHMAGFEEKFKDFSKQLSEQRRAVRTDVQVKAESISQDALTMEQFLDLPPGTILKDSQVVRIKGLFRELTEPVRLMAQHAAENPGDQEALIAVLDRLSEVQQGLTRIAGVFAETGRSTRLLRSTLPGGQAASATPERVRIADPYINQWLDFFRDQEQRAKMGGAALTPDKLVSVLATMKTQEEIVHAAKALGNPTKWDMFVEYWINGLLSSPQTHATNILSNMATIAWGIPERAMASMLSRSVRPSETTAMIRGVLEAHGDAMKLAWQSFKEEKSVLGTMDKTEQPRRAITGDALGFTGVPGAAVDFLGSVVRLPGRFLLASDDFFKAIAYRAELRALAARTAFQEVNAAGLSGRAAAKAMQDIERKILGNPLDYPMVDDAAKEYAAYVTFTRDLGETGQKIQAALATPIGRILVPFVRTPTNIFKYAGERTPLALLSGAVRDEIKAGGARRALQLSKISLGSMTMAYMASLAAEGMITGGGPKERELLQQKKATGWQAYSIKVGDKYYRYSRIEPLGSLIGAAADIADIMGQLPQEDADQLAAAVTVAISRNISQKTFIKGLAGALDAISSQDINVVQAYFEKELPTILPYSSALSSLTRETDPVLREVSDIIDAFKARIPGYSTDLPPMRNIWGEKIILEGGLGPDMITPIYTSTVRPNPVADEIVRLGLRLEMPSKQIEGVHLTPEEYDTYVVLAGGTPTIQDKTLLQMLNGVIQSDLYRQASGGPDGGKAALISRWVTAYRERARQIMQVPEESQRYIKQKFPDLLREIGKKREQDMRKFNAPVEAR